MKAILRKRFVHIFIFFTFLLISFPSSIVLSYFVHIVRQSIFQQVNISIDDPHDPHSIRWIGEFSSPDALIGEDGFGKKIWNFIFGKEEQKIIRPISIFNPDSNRFLILDQGRQLPLFIDKKNNESKFIHLDDDKSFPSLVGVCGFEENKILFTDSRLNKIYQLDFSQDYPSVLHTSIELQQPTGIAYSPKTKKIWISETFAHRITIIDANGIILKQIGQRGTAQGEFNFPTSIWISETGFVYIVDSMNFRIQIFDRDGNFVSMFGEHGDATGYFASCKGIATDSHENIYIVDALFHTVQIFDREGQFLINFGSQGREAGNFWMPSGIFIDKQDRIYVADSYNSRIQIFQLIHGK